MKPIKIEPSDQKKHRSLFFRELDEQTLESLQPAKKKKNPSILLSVTVNGRNRHTEVRKFPCVIGRSKSDADLVCNDQSVSNQHAIIDIQERKVVVIDNYSRNGIEIGGLRLNPNTARPLFQGDVFLLGNVEVKVVKITNPD